MLGDDEHWAGRYPVPVAEGAIEDNLTDEDLELDTLIPDSANQPYDMHEVITRILDDDEFSDLLRDYYLKKVYSQLRDAA